MAVRTSAATIKIREEISRALSRSFLLPSSNLSLSPSSPLAFFQVVLARRRQRDKLRLVNRIELNPEVCGGRPVIRGTRITVQTVLSYLSAGDTVEDVLHAHPRLSRDDVLACLEYARRLSDLHTTVELAS